MQRPTSNDYIRPNESVTFTATTDTPEAVVFIVDYGDGITVELNNAVFSHYYSHDGEYTVNITARTRTNQQSKLQQVSRSSDAKESMIRLIRHHVAV